MKIEKNVREIKAIITCIKNFHFYVHVHLYVINHVRQQGLLLGSITLNFLNHHF